MVDLTVCILAFMHEKVLGELIDSVLDQETTYKFEVIIGVDFCSDGTLDVAPSSDCRAVRTPQSGLPAVDATPPLGPAAARCRHQHLFLLGYYLSGFYKEFSQTQRVH